MIDISINLLPEEVKKKKKIASENSTLITICITTGIIFAILLVLIFSLKATLVIYEKSSLKEIDNLENQINNFKDLKEKAIFITDRVEEIKKDIQQISYSQILLEISKSTPNDLQIDQITVNIKNEPMVRISGKTSSITQAVKFKEKLQINPLFTKTDLPTTSLDTATNQISFSIECNLKDIKLLK